MKIVLVGNKKFNVYGGYEKVILTIFNYLKNNLDDFTFYFLISLSHNQKFEIIKDFSKFNIEKFSDYNSKYIYKFFYYSKLMKNFILNTEFLLNFNSTKLYFKKYHKEEPDIILVTNPFYINTIYKIRNEFFINTKIIYWDHGDLNFYVKRFEKDIFRRILLERILINNIKKADAHFAISTGIKNYIQSYDPYSKVYTIFNPSSVNNNRIIKKSKTPIFTYIGRLDDKVKNLSFMFKGLSLIKKKWKLKIIGTGPDERKLKKIAKKLKIDSKIEWYGFQKDPYSILENEGVSALLLTSKSEGLPMVLIEAISNGIPVISSNCKTGPEDIIINGVNGYLFEEGNLDDFVNLLSKVITDKIKIASRDKIKETAKKFSEELVCKNFLNILKDISNKNC